MLFFIVGILCSFWERFFVTFIYHIDERSFGCSASFHAQDDRALFWERYTCHVEQSIAALKHLCLFEYLRFWEILRHAQDRMVNILWLFTVTTLFLN